MSLASLIKGFEQQVVGKNYMKYVNPTMVNKVVAHIAEIGGDVVEDIVDELVTTRDYSKLLPDPNHNSETQVKGVLRLIVRDAIEAYKNIHSDSEAH